MGLHLAPDACNFFNVQLLILRTILILRLWLPKMVASETLGSSHIQQPAQCRTPDDFPAIGTRQGGGIDGHITEYKIK